MIFSRIIRSKLLLIILAPFILFAPIYLTGKALFWGTPAIQFVPWRNFAWEVIKSGEIPLMNPLVGMGAPLIANFQSAIFYPPNWLSFLFKEIGGIGALAWVQAPIVAAHLAWAGLGMAFLARRLGLGRLSQAVSGLAFGLSGYLVARAGFLSINAVVAWLPWIIFLCTNLVFEINSEWITLLRDKPSFILRLKRSISSSIITILILAFLLGMMLLAGHAQTAWYTILLLLIWCGFLVFGQVERSGDQESGKNGQIYILPVRNRIYKFLGVGLILFLSLIIALALTSIQILPTTEYLLESQRAAEVDYEKGLTYSFWPWRFITLIAPDMFGNPAAGDYWGYANYWEDAVYIGLLPFVLAIIAVWNGFKGHLSESKSTNSLKNDQSRFNRLVLIRFLIGTIIVSFVLALGKNTPLFPWLYQYVPTFDMFNAPTRFSLWAVFTLALLAGIGIEYWHRPTNRALYWTRLGTAGAFAVMLGSGIAWMLMGDISPSFIKATALAGAGLVIIGCLTLTAPEYQNEVTYIEEPNALMRNRPWSWLVCLFITLDLIVAGWGLNPGVDLEFYRQEAPTTSEIREMVGDGRLFIPFEDEYSIKFSRFFQFESLYPGEDWINLRAVQLPNLSMLDDLVSANNFDPIVPGRFEAWLNIYRNSNHETQRLMLNLMGVNVVEEVDLDSPYGVSFVPFESLNRIRWVPCGIFATSGENALDLTLSGMVNIHEEVVLEGVQPIFISQCDRNARGITNLEYENQNEIHITVNAEEHGYVLLSNTWYPGWQAEVDGTATEILRANYLFSAVVVPDGIHDLRLVYQPTTFYIGAMVSLISILGLLLITIYIVINHRLMNNKKSIDKRDNSRQNQ